MSTKWLLKNASRFDRICYHIGNSPFHQTILTCLQQWPGAVVMHETSLGDLIYSYESGISEVNKKWLITLYACHGYQPLLEANKEQGVPINTIQSYPCITQVLDRSLGTIVHSEIARRQIQSHFGDNSSHLSCCVPMCTKNRNLRTKEGAKTRLGFDKNTILICTFGMVGKAKLSLEIAEAWSRSTTKSRFSSQLVYVGENQPGSYGQSLSHRINQEDIKNQTKICGWINDELYEEYLAASDLALQFRTINRGETSAAIFDVVCSGVTTITNSRATISDLEASYIKITSEYPTVEEIATEIDVAIAEIVANKNDQLKEAESLRLKHSPEVCALKYRENIEVIYKSRKSVRDSVISWAANAAKQRSISAEQAAHIIRRDFNLNHPKKKQLFVDVSQIARSDYKTGIQRVVRSLVLQFIQLGIEGYRVEPVWLVSRPDGWHYRYARAWTMQTIGYQEQLLEDACIDANDGDILLLADLTGGYFIEADRCGVYDQLIQSGVTITAIVYDILPIQFPQYFPEGANDAHEKWLRCISARANSLVCISKAVADEVDSWLRENQTDKPQDQQISWFHLGADLDNSAPTEGLPTNIDDLKSSIKNNISFLMVGTVEPRKGHQQTLEAFQILHERGCNVSLVIVGKRGWMVNQLIDKMMNASTSEKDIFWYENASDEFLNWLYMHCNCLLAASEGEGFGLPLIEAARHNLPLLVRDIPVFREVAGSAAYYFKAANKTELADSVQDWCVLYQTDNIPKPDDLKYIEWKQSAIQLIDVVGLKVENRQ